MNGHNLRKVFTIDKVYNLKYFSFQGEKKIKNKGFFALIFSDSSDIEVITDKKNYKIKAEKAFFLTSGEEYTIKSEKQTQILNILFYSSSPLAERFDGGQFATNSYKKTLLAKLIEAGDALFEKTENPDDFPSIPDNAGVSVEQVFENCLELFVIDCVKPSLRKTAVYYENPLDEDDAMRITEKIYAFLGDNLEKTFTLDDLAEKLFFSTSYLKTVFHKTAGKSIKQAFTEMKIQESKRLMRSGVPVAEISERLCFCNVNYFYRVFAKETGMTPLKYKNSLLDK